MKPFRKKEPSIECKCDYNFTCRYCLNKWAFIVPVVFEEPVKKSLTNGTTPGKLITSHKQGD